jgi:hypothetical protein
MIATALVFIAFTGPCMEDMPCHNWRTMDNHRRGVVTLAGRFKVVTGPQFDRLNRACRIDWERSAKLRFDGPRCDVQNY